MTGAAGFIGYHLCRRLLQQGQQVVGLDDLNDRTGGRALKQARIADLARFGDLQLHRGDVRDPDRVAAAFGSGVDRVFHLAAEAGVRRSVESPQAYVATNLAGTVEILEGCRRSGVDHLVYASSSSVYGLVDAVPQHEGLATDRVASPYAATKVAQEALVQAWSHLHGLNATGLRLFTVYGAWGRPDMALSRFTAAILAGDPIDLFNGGHMARDFTAVDDVVEAALRLARIPGDGHRIVNVGWWPRGGAIHLRRDPRGGPGDPRPGEPPADAARRSVVDLCRCRPPAGADRVRPRSRPRGGHRRVRFLVP